MPLTIALIALLVAPALWDLFKVVKSLQVGKREFWGRTIVRNETPALFFAVTFGALATEVVLLVFVFRFFVLYNNPPHA